MKRTIAESMVCMVRLALMCICTQTVAMPPGNGDPTIGGAAVCIVNVADVDERGRVQR